MVELEGKPAINGDVPVSSHACRCRGGVVDGHWLDRLALIIGPLGARGYSSRHVPVAVDEVLLAWDPLEASNLE